MTHLTVDWTMITGTYSVYVDFYAACAGICEAAVHNQSTAVARSLPSRDGHCQAVHACGFTVCWAFLSV